VPAAKNFTTLSDQFDGALSRLELLIGSYARRTAIYPGKDVDVFTKLTKLDTNSGNPKTAFEAVRDVLVKKYRDRAEPQERSIRVTFPIDGEEDFHVDVVPAVRNGSRWAIPRHDTNLWDAPNVQERWVETDPEELTQRTQERNKSPEVDGRGAYVPTVKLVRQIRRHHRGKAKPGGFYFELMTYWTFEGGVEGDSFAEILANALTSIAAQLTSDQPLIDPVFMNPYKPAPDPADRTNAARVFTDLAREAQSALTLDECAAAVIWRKLLGNIDDFGPIFEIPPGCDARGRKLPAFAVASTGGEEANRFATDRDN
jgi:hypothetical protein